MNIIIYSFIFGTIVYCLGFLIGYGVSKFIHEKILDSNDTKKKLDVAESSLHESDDTKKYRLKEL